ncbi:MAG TPA: HEPN domain-containing protein [Chryseolinea sp.]|nr:HEPN domain-containing protein [Chryseolinea sp.]
MPRAIKATLDKIMKGKQIGVEQLDDLLEGTQKNKFKALANFVSRMSLGLRMFTLAQVLTKPEHHAIFSLKVNELEETVTEASKNLIVTCVSAIEVYFKEVIVENADGWNVIGYDKLLSEKITLSEAYHLFKHTDVSREAIVAEHYSFQSIEQIASTMDTLTGSKFYDKVVQTTTKDVPKKGNWDTDYQPHLRELFELRNRIIHENTSKLTINGKKTLQLWTTALSFIIRVHTYVQIFRV